MANTEIDLITGFLGAGKTTFIQRYARLLSESGISCAVIENEFGEAGVDSAELADMGVKVRELSGGCVCCTQKVNFYNAMCELAGEVERVIVEPSGIFRADDFIDMLDSPSLRDRARPGMLLCVVSPELPEEHSPAFGVLRDELAFAGSAYISRCDSASEDEIARARRQLIDMGMPEERIFAIEPNSLTLDDIMRMRGSIPAHRRFCASNVAHMTAFQSTTLRPARIFTRDEAQALLENLRGMCCGHVLRAKGRLRGEGCGWSVNMTPDALSVRECGAGDAYLNVIGEGLRRREIRRLTEEI